MRDERKQAAARTESAFRETNERIVAAVDADEVAIDAPGDDDLVPILCECARDTCEISLHVTRDDYERVRENGAMFIVAPGHVLDDVENIVEHFPNAWVVRKVGEAGRESKRFDSRN